MSLSVSLINILNSTGPSTDPWGTPLVTGLHLDIEPLTATLWLRPSNQFLTHRTVHPSNPWLSNLERRMLWGTVWKGFTLKYFIYRIIDNYISLTDTWVLRRKKIHHLLIPFFSRIIKSECLGLERTLKINEFQAPFHVQGLFPLQHIAQSPVQPGLELFQGQDIHNFSGQPVPVPHHPHSKEFISYI